MIKCTMCDDKIEKPIEDICSVVADSKLDIRYICDECVRGLAVQFLDNQATQR